MGVRCGADEGLMQIIGNITGEIPLVGIWFNGLSGLTKEIVSDAQRSASTMFQLMMNCLMANFLDSLFIGLIYSSLKKFILFCSGARRIALHFFLRHAGYHLFCVIVSTVASVFILYLIKRVPSQQSRALIISGANIAIMLIGVAMMFGLGRSAQHKRLSALSFLVDAALGAFQASAGIGCLCTLFFIPTALRNGLPLAGMLVWLLFAVLFALLLFFVTLGSDLVNERKY